MRRCGTGRLPVRRSVPTSQGGDTGSNPVGTAQEHPGQYGHRQASRPAPDRPSRGCRAVPIGVLSARLVATAVVLWFQPVDEGRRPEPPHSSTAAVEHSRASCEVRSTRARTPRSICRAITKSAGTTTRRYTALTHLGPARIRLRKMKRVHPPPTSRRTNAQVQSIHAPKRSSHCGGRCRFEWRTRAHSGTSWATSNSQLASGGPSGIGSPTASPWNSGSSRSALGPLAGNRSRSTHLEVYQPPRCQPIYTSQGQTRSGGALMVTECVVRTIGFTTISSPARGSLRSLEVAP